MTTDDAPRRAEQVYRTLIKIYPRSWRDAHEAEVLGVLLDVASEDGRNRVRRIDAADLVVRGLWRRALSWARFAEAVACVVVGLLALVWVAGGPGSTYHLRWAWFLTGIAAASTLIRVIEFAARPAGRRRESASAPPARSVRTLFATLATLAAATIAVPCFALFGSSRQYSWWWWQGLEARTGQMLTRENASVLLLDTVVVVGLAASAWINRALGTTWRATALPLAALLGMASWLVQLNVFAPPLDDQFRGDIYAIYSLPLPVDLHGLPGVLLIASVGLAVACVPTHRSTDGGPRELSGRRRVNA